MIRRWIIRALFLTMLLVCAGASVGSYWQEFYAVYSGGEQDQVLIVASGSFWFREIRHPMVPVLGLNLGHRKASPSSVRDSYESFNHFAGFAYEWKNISKYSYLDAMVPLWFPTLMSALLLWFAWRKTKATGTGKAFPIEPVPAKAGS